MLHRITLLMVLLITVVASGDVTPTTRPAIHVAHEQLKKLTWQLVAPTSTFTDRSLFESIDLLHSLDIHHLEIAPGDVSKDSADALLAKLKSVHMDIVSYGPVDLDADDASAKAVFAFAKKLKAKDMVASSPADSRERLSKFAAESGVNLVFDGDTPATGAVMVRITAVDSKMIAELKHTGFKGAIVVVCKPGNGESEINRFIDTINTLSDAIRSMDH